MATQGCYMAEGLKGENSQPLSFVFTAEKRLPLCACTQYQKSCLAKQNGPTIIHNLPLVILTFLIIL